MSTSSTRESKWPQHIALIISVGAFLFGIYQYIHQTNRNLKEQFHQELWMKKKDIYMELGGILGHIAAGPQSDTEFRSYYLKFSSLYYGSGAILTDPPITAVLTDIMHTFFLEFDYKNPDQLRLFREQVKRFDDVCKETLQQDLEKL